MASPAVMSSLLQTLPPRPPTPPKDSVQEANLQTRHLLVSSAIQSTTTSLHTPPGALSPGSRSSSSRRKRVDFSAQTEYQEPPVYPEGETKRVPTPVSLPSSVSRPIKSILKIPYGPNPLDPNTTPLDPSDTNANLGAMLDSTIQQLAGADRDSRLDSYMMLIRALKASNNLPDRVALQEKMSFFMQFMQRDITAKATAGTIDLSLVNQALNLLITFLNFPAIASTLTSDFGMFIVDHCIRSFEDTSVPKEVVRHLMQVIAVQNFSLSKVMTSDRVGRLVSSLRKIDEHVKGKSIIMSRVLIYRKLIKQCRQLMVVHSDWLLDLFTDMLSELKEIRSAAIFLGLEAGFSIGKEKSISRKVMEIFNTTNEEKRYIEFYQEILRTMAKGRTESPAVPQIWSVVVLFLRCPMDKWDFFAPWLQIIQDCFNSGDYKTKIEANVAWCRLVYVMHSDERSFSKTIPTLSQPFMAQLRRKASPGTKHVDVLRDTVVGGVRHLLYYTFKPNSNLTLLDRQWDSCVNPLLTLLLERSAAYDGMYHTIAILAGLFDCTTPRVWNPERVMEKPLIQADELPAIDSKWIRRNAARVFQLVEPIMQKNFTGLRDMNSPTHKLWRNLVAAVASAASKEIKVSLDTAVFLAHAFNTLQKIWKQGPQEGSDTGPGFLKSIQAYLSVLVEMLGLLPFTEKLLSMDKDYHFVPISTPSHRPGKVQGLTKSPLKHLFAILSSLPQGVQDDDTFAKFFANVFSPFFATKSDKGRMDLTQELLTTIPMDAMIPYGPWVFTADIVSRWLDAGHSSIQTSGSGAETPVGHEYRDMVRILERGLRSTPNLPWTQWRAFFDTLTSHVREQTGEAGVAIVIVEPLAKVVLDQCSVGDAIFVSATMAKCTKELISVATQPRDRQAVDAARRRLWGSGSRSSSFDTFDSFYKAVNLLLHHLYYQGVGNEDRVLGFLNEVGSFLERCNPQLVTKSLLALQDGLVPWIQDERAESHRQPAEVVEMMKSTWQKICNVIGGYDPSQPLQLDKFEPLLCAAFESKHRQIVNSALSLWNHVFEHVDELKYPKKLKAVLLTLRPFVDIVLPGLELSSIESGGQEPFFVDTQDDVQLPQLLSAESNKRSDSRPSSSRSRHSKSPSVKLSVPSKRRSDTTPNTKAFKIQRRGPTPKLRHDDSQIQFATIASSSPVLPYELESQVLTDRQREVRARQQEVAKLFPDVRSSPARNASGLSRISSEPPTPQELPVDARATTPEPKRTFDDFISSTPTPRRGQVMGLPDQLDSDLADPPSSPPEPRRNPLRAEIESRSATNSLMDEWQFSSSPVSGSPMLGPHEQSSQMELANDFEMLSAEGEGDDESYGRGDSHDKLEPELGESAVGSVVEESILASQVLGESEDIAPEEAASESVEPSLPVPEELPEAVVPDVAAPEVTRPRSKRRSDPSTPQGNHRPLGLQDTPGSGSEALLDTPSNPQPSSGRKSQRTPRIRGAASINKENKENTPNTAVKSAERSFEASDIDERSLLKLVVQLDAGKVNTRDYQYREVTETPEQLRLRQLRQTPEHTRARPRSQAQTPVDDALDCIIVSSPFKEPWAEDEDASPASESTPAVEADVIPSSQVSSRGRGGYKRKRPNSKLAQGAAKKRKSVEPAAAVAEVGQLLRRTSGRRSRATSGASLATEKSKVEARDTSVEGSTQDTESTQPSQVVELEQSLLNGDELSSEDMELEVQSQIVQETEAQISQAQSGLGLAVTAGSMEVEPATEEQLVAEEIKEVETPAKRTKEAEQEEVMVEDSTEIAARPAEKESTPKEAHSEGPIAPEAAVQEATPETPFGKIMGFFRGGLEALRTATLARNEVYQIEDMFMNMRRELLEAEARGRAPPS